MFAQDLKMVLQPTLYIILTILITFIDNPNTQIGAAAASVKNAGEEEGKGERMVLCAMQTGTGVLMPLTPAMRRGVKMAKQLWTDIVQDLARQQVSAIRADPSNYKAVGFEPKTNWLFWEMLVYKVFHTPPPPPPPHPLFRVDIIADNCLCRALEQSQLDFFWWMCCPWKPHG